MQPMRFRLVTLVAVLAIASLGVGAGCGGDDDDGGTATGAGADLGLITEGQLLVGTDTPYPPFEIGQPPNITGYDIEVGRAVAQHLGLQPTFQDTSFDTIFRDLAQGKFDFVLAATTITPERQQKVAFSDPYYAADQSLVVTPGSDIKTVEDLADKTVGAQDGTTGEDYANDETDASEVRGFPEGPDAINALKAGQVDATIIDQPVAVDALEKEGGIEIAAIIPTGELYGIPVAKDNTALLGEVNKALQEMKTDGTLAGLYQKYFKTDPPQSVLTGKTTAP
jgi:polar amino acid transport system substrate-binding protein